MNINVTSGKMNTMGLVRGKLVDFKPIVDCFVSAEPAQAGRPAKSIACKAMIDTGSTDMTVRKRVADALGLKATGAEPVENICVGVTHQSIPYTCCIYLPCEDPMSSTGRGNMGFTELRTFVQEMTPEVDILIGMNLLSMLELNMLPDGTFTLRT